MNQRKTGEFIRCLRKEKGLTQEQLAECFYVSSRTVSRWETGNNMPDVDTLIELALYALNGLGAFDRTGIWKRNLRKKADVT